MRFFDAFLSIGRTNKAIQACPRDETEALVIMDRYDVDEAFVFHTVARDGDPEQGNGALAGLSSGRLHPVWAFDPVFVAEESPGAFLSRALSAGARAIMINPTTNRIDLRRSPRLNELARLLEARAIPLMLVHHLPPSAYTTQTPDNDVDWYQIADFCCMYPKLPVLLWEQRSRSNRPLFDALALTDNLLISLSCVWQTHMVERICSSFGPRRILFSLGLPGLDPGSFQGVVTYAGIDPEAKSETATGLAMRLIREARYEQ